MQPIQMRDERRSPSARIHARPMAAPTVRGVLRRRCDTRTWVPLPSALFLFSGTTGGASPGKLTSHAEFRCTRGGMAGRDGRTMNVLVYAGLIHEGTFELESDV